MRKIFHLEPIYKSFVWAGRKLIDEFGLDQNMDKIGTIYCAIAIPGDLDSIVREANEPLSFLRSSSRVVRVQRARFSGSNDNNLQ